MRVAPQQLFRIGDACHVYYVEGTAPAERASQLSRELFVFFDQQNRELLVRQHACLAGKERFLGQRNLISICFIDG